MKWISVKDALPEDTREVLFLWSNRWFEVGYYDGNDWYEWWYDGNICSDVTHWMPLPDPPKQLKNKFKNRNYEFKC